MKNLSSWFKNYTSHPFGKGASYGDYALTLLLAAGLFYVVYRVIED